MKPKPEDTPQARWQRVLDSTPNVPPYTFADTCDQIVSITIAQINQRAPHYFDKDKMRYPAQGMLEEIIRRLQQSV